MKKVRVKKSIRTKNKTSCLSDDDDNDDKDQHEADEHFHHLDGKLLAELLYQLALKGPNLLEFQCLSKERNVYQQTFSQRFLPDSPPSSKSNFVLFFLKKTSSSWSLAPV